MSKKRTNPIKRVRDIPDVKVSPYTPKEYEPVDVPGKPQIKKPVPMLKRILGSKIIKGILSVLGGALGFTGSIFAGLDPEYAFLVAVTAVIAIFGGIEKAAKFKGLFDDDLKNQSNTEK